MEINVLVVFSLILLLFTRLLGAVFTLDLYVKQREKRLLYFMTGWLTTATSAVIPLLDPSNLTNTANILLQSVLLNIGLTFLLIGGFQYFSNSSFERYTLSAIFVNLIPIFVSIFNIEIAYILISVFRIFILLNFSYIVYKCNRNNILSLSKNYGLFVSGILLIIIFSIVSVILREYTFTLGAYETNNPLLPGIWYLIQILINTYGIFLLIFIEQAMLQEKSNELEKEKNRLKDSVNHEIGNLLQIIHLGAGLLLELETEENKKQTIDQIIKNTTLAGDLVKKIRQNE